MNKDYYERLLKEKNENGISLHGDNIEEIERKKAINQMNKLQIMQKETNWNTSREILGCEFSRNDV